MIPVKLCAIKNNSDRRTNKHHTSQFRKNSNTSPMLRKGFKMFKFKGIYLIGLIGLIYMSTGCSADTKQLTALEKYTADTLYNNSLNEWRNTVDSMCMASKDTIYRRAVDSLKTERMAEIEIYFMK